MYLSKTVINRKRYSATIILVATKGNPNVDMTDEAYDALVGIS